MSLINDALKRVYVVSTGSTATQTHKVTVFDAGASVFDAWLFSMYPSVHPFTHPRYGLSLKEGVPAT